MLKRSFDHSCAPTEFCLPDWNVSLVIPSSDRHPTQDGIPLGADDFKKNRQVAWTALKCVIHRVELPSLQICSRACGQQRIFLYRIMTVGYDKNTKKLLCPAQVEMLPDERSYPLRLKCKQFIISTVKIKYFWDLLLAMRDMNFTWMSALNKDLLGWGCIRCMALQHLCSSRTILWSVEYCR